MTGTMDLWVDRWQGFLVRSELDMVQHDDLVESFGFSELRMHEVATVTAVDDPANVVEPPDLTLPTRPPGQEGDPALAPMVRQAFDALDALDSYRITSVGSTMGSESQREITVREPARGGVGRVMTAFGRDFIDVIRIGDREWSRPGEGEWSPSKLGDGTCGEDRCTAGYYLSTADVTDKAETFTLVEDGAVVNGVPTPHLRSTAGAESQGRRLGPRHRGPLDRQGRRPPGPARQRRPGDGVGHGHQRHRRPGQRHPGAVAARPDGSARLTRWRSSPSPSRPSPPSPRGCSWSW